MLDPFAGFGTTLFAAERTGRRARLIEIDPAYCDVIVRRWQAHRGKTLSWPKSNQTFAEVEGHRLRAGRDPGVSHECARQRRLRQAADQAPVQEGTVRQPKWAAANHSCPNYRWTFKKLSSLN